jgi:hypothetical protein
MLESSSSSSTLTQRFETLKKKFSGHRRHRHSSSTSNSLQNENNHKIKNKIKLFKRNHQKYFYSAEQYKIIEKAKHCRVILEPTYRQDLKLNTTYLIGKTIEGQMILLPKQLIEQANVITITDNDISQQQQQQQEQTNNLSSIDYSDISDDEDIEPSRKKGIFKTSKTTYTSQGNVVTCITGSFN